jgi:hypothetical protein
MRISNEAVNRNFAGIRKLTNYSIQTEGFTAKRTFIIIILVLALIVVSLGAGIVLPFGVDWHLHFRPAARAVIEGRSPYSVYGFYNPPWALLPLLPLALLPEWAGRGCLIVLSIASYFTIAVKSQARPSSLAAFLLAPPILLGIKLGNLDWMPLLGLLMAPRFGIILVIIKPQVGAAVAVYWIINAYRNGGWKALFNLLLPLTLITLSTILIYGFWPVHMLAVRSEMQQYSLSLFPLSIPIGLFLLLAALRKQNVTLAVPASQCLSPHVIWHTWGVAMLPLLKYPVWIWLASGLTWVINLFVFLHGLQVTQ